MSVLSNIVERLHVGEPNREVVKYVRSRLSKQMLTAPMRKRRHELLRSAIDIHATNRRLYQDVMSGRW